MILVAFYLWAYEAFALWDRPAWTAAIIAGYFVMAFVIDGLFRGASFCKYLCPIGQFNFVQSQVSPLEVTVHDPDVCARCRTRDCIRGRDGIPGCELGLFQPRKVGNLDCTFCLDCVHSCPHENVGILPVVPGPRPGDVGRPVALGHRPAEPAPRPGRPDAGRGVRWIRQRRGNGRTCLVRGRPAPAVARPAVSTRSSPACSTW